MIAFLSQPLHDPNPFAHLWLWIEIHTGAQNESGAYYGFWSGFGSDLTEFAILFSLVHVFRHTNCHTKGCWRFGKPVEGTPYRACHKHHPDHPGDARNVTTDVIHDAFHARRTPVSPAPLKRTTTTKKKS